MSEKLNYAQNDIIRKFLITLSSQNITVLTLGTEKPRAKDKILVISEAIIGFSSPEKMTDSGLFSIFNFDPSISYEKYQVKHKSEVLKIEEIIYIIGIKVLNNYMLLPLMAALHLLWNVKFLCVYFDINQH